MTSITHLEPQQSKQKQHHHTHLHQNKYSQLNLNTIQTLKNSSSSSNDNNANNKVEYAKPKIYLPYNNYSVDERNYCDESVPPTPLSSKNKQQQKQHFITFSNKNTNQKTIDDINKQNYNFEQQQIHLQKNQQQQQVQKHYRNATSGNGLNLMSHFKSLVNVSKINFKLTFKFF